MSLQEYTSWPAEECAPVASLHGVGEPVVHELLQDLEGRPGPGRGADTGGSFQLCKCLALLHGRHRQMVQLQLHAHAPVRARGNHLHATSAPCQRQLCGAHVPACRMLQRPLQSSRRESRRESDSCVQSLDTFARGNQIGSCVQRRHPCIGMIGLN